MKSPDANNHIQLLDNADALSRRFPIWLCDVWGVVHNGLEASTDACDALERHRKAGGTVILITNAPRPSEAILPQLAGMEVSPDCYDAIVSSGDVTRQLVSQWAGRNVYHLGPEKDLALLEGLPVTYTALAEADVVLCSGLEDDERESPEDYRDQLTDMKARNLRMICANPDKVVRRGDKLLPCAGALAVIYDEIGGAVDMAGKPHAPIYQECLRQAAGRLGQTPELNQVLAIGDGMSTDVNGAASNGIDILFIVTGIHEFEFDGAGVDVLADRLRQAAPDVKIAGIMTGLK